MSTLKLLPAALIAAGILGACDRPQFRLSQWHTVGDAGWRYNDTLAFNKDSADTLPVGRMVIGVRHTAAYPYSNLWIELSYLTADSLPAADTVEIKLADAFGHWYGSGTGASYQLTDTVVPHHSVLPSSQVRLRHIMRMDTVPEIEQMGISF